MTQMSHCVGPSTDRQSVTAHDNRDVLQIALLEQSAACWSETVRARLKDAVATAEDATCAPREARSSILTPVPSQPAPESRSVVATTASHATNLLDEVGAAPTPTERARSRRPRAHRSADHAGRRTGRYSCTLSQPASSLVVAETPHEGGVQRSYHPWKSTDTPAFRTHGALYPRADVSPGLCSLYADV